MLRVTGADGIARKDTGIILVWAEHPYVQFELLVFLHWFAVGGYKQARESGLSGLCVVLRVMRLSRCPRES